MNLKKATRWSVAALALVCVSLCCAAADQPGRKATLRQLRFSPDGRYVLAQDNAEVTVLTVAPFAILFRIPAGNATDAQFTPDSQQIVFASSVARVDAFEVQLGRPKAHVERWRISDRAQVGSFAIPLPACGTTGLFPDGRMVVCLDLKGTLEIVDVASARVIFEQKRFATAMDAPDWSPYPPIVGDPGSATMHFSPDARYLIVSLQATIVLVKK